MDQAIADADRRNKCAAAIENRLRMAAPSGQNREPSPLPGKSTSTMDQAREVDEQDEQDEQDDIDGTIPTPDGSDEDDGLKALGFIMNGPDDSSDSPAEPDDSSYSPAGRLVTVPSDVKVCCVRPNLPSHR
jgi:hypothetical protein